MTAATARATRGARPPRDRPAQDRARGRAGRERAHDRSRPRPYLASAERRSQLLEAAARLVRTRGWSSVSMQGLAAEAGVSRQLVYAHFERVSDLHRALLIHLFERAYEATASLVRSGRSVPDVLRGAFEQFLDMPPDQRRALRALATGDEPRAAELARAKRTLRRRISGLWVPYIVQLTGRDESEANALAWMLLMAAWGMSDMVSERVISRPHALAMFVRLAVQALDAARRPSAAPAPAAAAPLPHGRLRRPRPLRRSPDA